MENKTRTGCPFCMENGKDKIIHQTPIAYLIVAPEDKDKVVPNCYFVIPKQHIGSIRQLPNDWQKALTALLNAIPGIDDSSFDVEYNEGKDAGQLVVGHVHASIVFRRNEAGKRSYQLGLKDLIEIANSIGRLQ